MVEAMEIPKGFKKTEVGIIPNDWDLKNIVENSTMKARIGWQGLTVAEYLNKGDYFLITGTDFVDGKIKWDTCHYVNKARYAQDKNIQVKIGDILITKDGTIGKVAYVDRLPLNATLNSGVFVIRPKGNIYLPLFLSYIFNSFYFRDFLNNLVAGSTIIHLYQKDFVSFSFPLPPTKVEQTAIAEALNDADALIAELEKLIAKKKAIKQGAMQELLNPKKGWNVKPLGMITDYRNGKSYEHHITENGKYLLITLNSIDIDGKLKSDHLKVDINDSSLNKNDLIMILSDVAHGNFLGLTDIIPENDKYVLNQRVGALKNIRYVTPYFLRMFININQKYFKLNGQGSSQQNLGKDSIVSFDVYFPEIEEQNKICQILTDTDAEIEALENKLDKYKMLKQGMMQNLLTGKIRLI